MLVSLLNRVKLLLQLRDVLLLRHFHLLEDFFLRVELTIQIFGLRDSLVDLVLELEVLLLKDLNLAICGVQLDLVVFQGKNLVFEL